MSPDRLGSVSDGLMYVHSPLHVSLFCCDSVLQYLTFIRHSLIREVLQVGVQHTVMLWGSGNALVSINEVKIRRARLVLGWVTVSGYNSRCGTFISAYNQSPGQLSLVIPLW